mgnify:FL=1
MEKTNLVAPGVRSFMEYTLYNCRRLKDKYTNMAWNLGLTLFFVFLIGGFLYYRYRGKPSKEEEDKKKQEAHAYIMQKLGNNIATRQIEEAAQKTGMLTGLPMYDKTLLPGSLGRR